MVENDRETLLTVGNRASAAWLADLRAAYSLWDTHHAETYLRAIVDAAQRHPRAILARIDETVSQPAEAIAGLRLAAGATARLVLCCTTEFEPLARRVLVAGANDYVLLPLREREVDAAIGYPRTFRRETARWTAPASASMDELRQVADLFDAVELRPREMLERLARLTRAALECRGATVVVHGAIATSGDVVTKPVMTAPLEVARDVVGQLLISERVHGAYTPADAEKLRHYAQLASRALQLGTAFRQLRQFSTMDASTGLPNRQSFDERLGEILRQAQRERFPVTVLRCDIEGLKSLKNNLGTDAVDRAISALGALFRRCCREHDVLARYADDELAIVLWDAKGPRSPGSKPLESAMPIFDRLRAAREVPPCGVGHPPVSLTAGLATYPWDATTPAELMHRADLARAQNQGVGLTCELPLRAG